MSAVLVTHADEPLGRRVVKTLFHDPQVERVLAVGAGAAPRAFERFLAARPARLAWSPADLARHRDVSGLFHGALVRELHIDRVVHLPQHAASEGGAPVVAGIPPRTAEARLVLQHCLEVPAIRHLVALGSAFVYRLAPGNANRVTEQSELDLDPDVPADLRSWIDCDMLFHAEVGHERLRVVLLRVPTVVATGGAVYLNPLLEGPPRPRVRPLGFDPLCALISDKDVAKGIQSAVLGRGRGVFNLAGREALPLSQLASWTRRPCLPVPGAALRALARGLRLVGDPRTAAALDVPQLRHGFTLDTARAERELGFRPRYRIGLSRAGDGTRRLETSPA